jgi:hypothetical protein
MNLIISPYIGMGDIKLGMDRAQIRNILNSSVESFVRNEYAEMPEDSFPDLGIFIEYKQPGVCDSIQVVKPLNPIWRGKQLLNTPFRELAAWFLEIDSERELDGTGFTSYKYGIGAYAPNHEEEPDCLAESIIVFSRGYYDT